MKHAVLYIYGAEQLCASCVNLPSAKETHEWLLAALSRKFPNQPFSIEYVDIHNPPQTEHIKQFAERVIHEDLFYPVVVLDGEIIGEGNPKLKNVVSKFEEYGYLAE
ncbi:disulfide oxidoreductase [Bacillus coahuilensis p1.1.43]|uniref:Disulfide oxidoreductase n=1 Tax=Bacillus coahuilensis p1.1.43 TaxID=1150625 RepID=A0A147K6H0_9BACI|nr:YuzD family protein [Bacillus coahuilensis]KUP05375.1 disulfide oxidoreductase [Bacillus coahuilensis p1.1.43]